MGNGFEDEEEEDEEEDAYNAILEADRNLFIPGL